MLEEDKLKQVRDATDGNVTRKVDVQNSASQKEEIDLDVVDLDVVDLEAHRVTGNLENFRVSFGSGQQKS